MSVRRIIRPHWLGLSQAIGIAGASAVIGTAALVAEPSNPATAVPQGLNESSTFQTFAASNGVALRFHAFEGGDNGVLIYFSGDGDSGFETPEAADTQADSGQVRSMRRTAEDNGFDLIYLDHPTDSDSWWDGLDTSAAADAVGQLVGGLDPTRIELVGYSGGAEFLTSSVIPRVGAELPKVTGAVMIGGGSPGQELASPGPESKQWDLTWVVGEDDTYGSTTPSDWSAREASRSGLDAYVDVGYTNAQIELVPGSGHTDYDIAQIADHHLTELVKAHPGTTSAAASKDAEPEDSRHPSRSEKTSSNKTREPAESTSSDPHEDADDSDESRPPDDARQPYIVGAEDESMQEESTAPSDPPKTDSNNAASTSAANQITGAHTTVTIGLLLTASSIGALVLACLRKRRCKL